MRNAEAAKWENTERVIDGYVAEWKKDAARGITRWQRAVNYLMYFVTVVEILLVGLGFFQQTLVHDYQVAGNWTI